MTRRSVCLTTVEEDLRQLLDLYDEGLVFTVKAMGAANHTKLRRRIQSRLGGNWLSVFRALRKLRPDLDHKRFFKRSPEGLYTDLQGNDVFCADESEVLAFASRMFAERAKKAPPGHGIARILGESPVLWGLYNRLKIRGVDVRSVVERATGRKFAANSSAPLHAVPMHDLNGEPHPPLGSFSELTVDTALAETVPEYPTRHRHEVLLTELVSGLVWEGSPYTGGSSPRVDILVDGKLVIEVSFATEKYNDNYLLKMAWKLARLREAGFHAVNIKMEDKAPANSFKLQAALAAIGVDVDREKLLDVLWCASFEMGREVSPLQEATVKNALTSDIRNVADAVRQLAAKGLTTQEIAVKLDVPYTNVYAILTRCGMVKKSTVRQEMLARHDRGMTVQQIADDLKTPYANVYTVLTRAGVLTKRPYTKPGAPYAAEVLRLHREGLTPQQIADKLQKPKANIYTLLHKRGLVGRRHAGHLASGGAV